MNRGLVSPQKGDAVAAPIRIVTVKDYQALVDEGALPLDVRRPSDFVEGHVRGSRNLPEERFLLQQELRVVGLERSVLLICQGTSDLRSTMIEVQAAGIEVAGILSGTPASWAARGLDVLGWTRLTPEHWALKKPAPALWDLRESHEAADPAWPQAPRFPLSGWLSGVLPPFQPEEALCLIGPRRRQIAAAVLLYHHGALSLYWGDTATPSVVANWGREGAQVP
jgi:rhodanese-related sulfurtransferase